MSRRRVVVLGVGLVTGLALTGCVGDPAPDPAEATIEVVLDTGMGEDAFCTLNRESVAPGRHEVSIVGVGEIRVTGPTGEEVLVAQGSELTQPKDPETLQTVEGTYTISCSDGTRTGTVQLNSAKG